MALLFPIRRCCRFEHVETTKYTKHTKTIVLMDTTVAKVNAADFEYLIDRKLLVIPTFFDNRLIACKVDGQKE